MDLDPKFTLYTVQYINTFYCTSYKNFFFVTASYCLHEYEYEYSYSTEYSVIIVPISYARDDEELKTNYFNCACVEGCCLTSGKCIYSHLIIYNLPLVYR